MDAIMAIFIILIFGFFATVSSCISRGENSSYQEALKKEEECFRNPPSNFDCHKYTAKFFSDKTVKESDHE